MGNRRAVVNRIAVALKDFLTDPERPTDLASLSERQATTAIEQALTFLPSPPVISIENGSAVIELADPKPQQAADGRKAFARAQKCGQRGEYGRAIQLYEEVLKALPAFQRQR